MHGFEAPKRSLYSPVDIDPPRKLSYIRLAALTVCFLGVQFGWAVQIAFTTPIFQELGVAKEWASFIWIAGPISGLVVQPVVGAVSDTLRSPFGRRRPFIFFGALFVILALAMISNAVDIGKALGDTDSHNRAIVIAIIGFWILDLSNNTIQGPCRALLVDMAPPDQQGLGSSFFSVMLGIGNLLAYFIGHLQLTKYLPFMGTDVRALFTTSMIVLAVCIGITVIASKEVPFVPEGPLENPFKKIFFGLKNMPSVVVRVCIVQFFAWFGWFTYLIYITDWVASNIYGGTPGSDRYNEGVREGSLALMINAGVTIIFSSVMPFLVAFFGIKPMYFAGNLILGGCLISTYFIHNVYAAIAVIAICGIPWAITMALPFAIIGQGVGAAESGLYMGALNIFIVLPQLLVSVSMGAILHAANNNDAVAFVCGGVSALIAAVAVFFLKVSSPVTEVVTVNSYASLKEDEKIIH